MITSLILAAALTGQAPAAKKPEPAPPMTAAQKRRAKYRAFHARQAEEDRREAVAAQQRAEAEYREWKALLPYQLEHQRQMLQRRSDAERSAALNRLAGALEPRSTWGYPAYRPMVAAPPEPPRIVNMPGQPYAP